MDKKDKKTKKKNTWLHIGNKSKKKFATKDDIEWWNNKLKEENKKLELLYQEIGYIYEALRENNKKINEIGFGQYTAILSMLWNTWNIESGDIQPFSEGFYDFAIAQKTLLTLYEERLILNESLKIINLNIEIKIRERNYYIEKLDNHEVYIDTFINQ